jgi:hypothetical protein
MSDQFEHLMRAVFQGVTGSKDEGEIQEFSFHMRECMPDLMQLASVYEHPDRYSQKECKEAVDRLLLHACGHIMRAARQYGGIIDSFGNET